MGRPRNPNIKRVESDTYKLGYAIIKDNQWAVRVSTLTVYTGLRPIDENIPRVKKIIDATVEQYRAGNVAGTSLKSIATPENSTIPSLYAAASMWYEEYIANKANLHPAYRDAVWLHIRAYTPEGKDIALDESAECLHRLVQHFSKMKAMLAKRGRSGGQQSLNTTRNRLLVWRRIFRWAVSMGWIRANPIEQIDVPKRVRRTQEKRYYTEVEYLGLMRETYRADREIWRLYLWLRLTGMRVHEALDMRWSDIANGILTIRGKGYEGRKSIRSLPLLRYPATDRSPVAKWQRVLLTILDAQRHAAERSHALCQAEKDKSLRMSYAYRIQRYDKGYIWGRGTYNAVWRRMNESKQRMNEAEDSIDIEVRDTRAMHAFRSMAEHMMKYRLRLPRDLMLRITGHSGDIHDSHYAIELSREELLREVDVLTMRKDQNPSEGDAAKSRQNSMSQVPHMPQSIMKNFSKKA